MSRLLVALAVIAFPAAAAAQWIPQQSGTDAELRGLSVVSRTVVWASGTRGRVLHTTDGGTTWRVDTVAGADSLDFRSVHAFDARTAVAATAGVAVNGQARIYRTVDGGRTWTLVWQTAEKGVFLDAIAFWDARHGLVLSDPVGGKPFVLRTSDGGRTWTRIAPDAFPPVLDGEASFAASGTCLTTYGPRSAYIATGGGATARVFRTSDRGRSWTVAPTPLHAGDPASGAFAVAFRDPRHGLAVGGKYDAPHADLPNVALSTDGGTTWHAPDGTPPAGYFSGVAWIPRTPATAVAVGLAGTARSTDGGRSWTLVDSTAYNSVGFATSDAGWAVGPRGRIARWAGGAPSPRRER